MSANPGRGGLHPAGWPSKWLVMAVLWWVGGVPFMARVEPPGAGKSVGVDDSWLRRGPSGLRARVTTAGIWVSVGGVGAGGPVRVVAARVGRGDDACGEGPLWKRLPTEGELRRGSQRIRLERPGLVEEYSVSAAGVRQDFLVPAPPPGRGDLRVELGLSGGRAVLMRDGVRLMLPGAGRALAYQRLRVSDAAGRCLAARWEVPAEDRLEIRVRDEAATYPVRIDPTFSDADWSGLGAGVGGYSAEVLALAVSGTNVYVGGSFFVHPASGGTAVNIARWNGQAWSGLGSGVVDSRNFAVDSVFGLALQDTNLCAVGGFTNMSGVRTTGAAQWNGRSWSAMAGFNGLVSALCASGGQWYAAADFETAVWTGYFWAGMGSWPGFNGSPPQFGAFATLGTNLYVGGYFVTADHQGTNLARWNGTGWTGVGPGPDSWVEAMLVSETNLYMAGNFTRAGGVVVNHIAKWDGTTWTALGLGMDADVRALAMSGGELYAGGLFTKADGRPANHIARWDGKAWSALGSGLDGTVNALAADGAGHLFAGGSFSHAGTNTTGGVARANLGRPAVILNPLVSQTAELGANVEFAAVVTGDPVPTCQWSWNGTTLADAGINQVLALPNVGAGLAGTYVLVVSNPYGATTSNPVRLELIAPVLHSWGAGLNLGGQTGSAVGLEYRAALGAVANWQPLTNVLLAGPFQVFFDASATGLPARYYRAWQNGSPGAIPTLDMQLVVRVMLTGTAGTTVRLDAINQFGPTDAWVTLATVGLTNAAQPYYDYSACRQPPRLYRVVPLP